MLTINNILDKFRAISVERISDFLNRNGIEHKRTELNAIEFMLKGWHWDLWIDRDYIKMDLVFPVTEETNGERNIEMGVSREACLEVTKQIRVMKAFYTSHQYVDKDKDNEIVKYDLLHFSFESFCYSMFEFSRLFYDGVNVIIGGYNEYHKHYKEIEAKLPKAPVGFTNYNIESSDVRQQITNRRRIGYV